MNKIRIKHCAADGLLYDCMTEGSEHDVIGDDDQGVWVLGHYGVPVLILFSEFNYIKEKENGILL